MVLHYWRSLVASQNLQVPVDLLLARSYVHSTCVGYGKTNVYLYRFCVFWPPQPRGTVSARHAFSHKFSCSLHLRGYWNRPSYQCRHACNYIELTVQRKLQGLFESKQEFTFDTRDGKMPPMYVHAQTCGLSRYRSKICEQRDVMENKDTVEKRRTGSSCRKGSKFM